MYFRPPSILKKIYPTTIWSFSQEEDGVFLTFDDGPCPEVTPWVLDVLDKYQAKATFFCIGKNVELYPELFKEILRRGHSVGNHTYSHIAGWRIPLHDYIQDVEVANALIDSKLYRPPYAKITISQANLLSRRYQLVMWNILSRDYNRKLSRKKCLKNVVPHLHPGAIVVFHDSKKAAKNLWYALPRTLEALKELNLKCKAIIL
ncbi:MAG: polysaccharide deacetylase family protein [Bacteroidales bacterium]|nr:polysaccharide deacetylase family protein [Bacteroidales bacterium]